MDGGAKDKTAGVVVIKPLYIRMSYCRCRGILGFNCDLFFFPPVLNFIIELFRILIISVKRNFNSSYFQFKPFWLDSS
jgi:hypothetical protein